MGLEKFPNIQTRSKTSKSHCGYTRPNHQKCSIDEKSTMNISAFNAANRPCNSWLAPIYGQHGHFRFIVFFYRLSALTIIWFFRAQKCSHLRSEGRSGPQIRSTGSVFTLQSIEVARRLTWNGPHLERPPRPQLCYIVFQSTCRKAQKMANTSLKKVVQQTSASDDSPSDPPFAVSTEQ